MALEFAVRALLRALQGNELQTMIQEKSPSKTLDISHRILID
jgi:hypothetical protein